MLIQELLADSKKNFGSSIYARDKDATITFAELDDFSTLVGAELAKISTDQSIGLLIKNSIEYLVLYFSIIKSGNIVIPLNPSIQGKTLRELMIDANICYAFTNKDSHKHVTRVELQNTVFKGTILIDTNENYSSNAELLKNILESVKSLGTGNKETKSIVNKKHEEDIAQILYTSGSTGKPKGICLSHKNLLSNMFQIIDRIRITNGDNMLVVLPFHYSYGNSLILSHLYRGASLTLCQNTYFPNQILNHLIKWKCTSLAGVSTHFILLLKRSTIKKTALPNLKYITIAGEPVLEWIVDELNEIKKNLDIYIMYGQSEATARISILKPEELRQKKGSVGRPLKGIDLFIVDENNNKLTTEQYGEVVVAGANIVKKFTNGKSSCLLKNNNKHLLYTGDYGKLDKDGFLYIIGRKDDMIKVGGERVFPLEIENVIGMLPEVKEVGVVGISEKESNQDISSYIGKIIAAYIVSDTTPSEDRIRGHCLKNLPAYKVPKRIYMLKELPRTANGKLKRAELPVALKSQMPGQ